MNNNKNGVKARILAIAFFALVVAGLVYWQFLRPVSVLEAVESQVAKRIEASAAKRDVSSKTYANPAEVRQQAALPAVPHLLKVRAVFAEYLATQDPKDFFDKYAKEKRSADAAYLMRQTLNYCSPYSVNALDQLERKFSEAKPTNELASEKLAALGRVRAACAGFSRFGSEDFRAEAEKLNVPYAESRDLVSKATQLTAMFLQRPPEENNADFEEIVRSKDALAYGELVRYISAARSTQMWEMGNPGNYVDPKLLSAAFASAPCYFDGNCVRSQLSIDAMCILGGDLSQGCAPMNILEYQQQNRLSPSEYRRLVGVLEWLRPGLENNQWPTELFKPRPLKVVGVK